MRSIIFGTVCSTVLVTAIPCPALAESVVEKVATTEVLTAAISFNAVPYSYIDADGDLVGYSIDILNLIETQMEEELGRDITLQVVEAGPSERISLLTSGEIDIACDARFTWERDRYVDFSLSYALSGIRLLTPPESTLAAPESLVGQRVAVYPNSLGQEVIELVQPEATLVPVTSVVEAFGALDANEVDAIAGDSVVLAGLVAQRGGETVYRIAPAEPLERYGIACMIPENNSTFMGMVNYAIAGLAQGYISGDPQSVNLVDQWFGDGGIMFLPVALKSAFFRSVLAQRAQVPPASTEFSTQGD